MSLRASAHTGVAIRVPAEKRCKPVGLRANSQLLRIRREKLLSVMSYRKEYGLPRRFAPRNDMQKVGRCARAQGRNDMQKLAGCLRVQERATMANLQCFSYSPKGLLFVLCCRRSYGLPRRGAAAPLLAMTCRNMRRACVCKNALPVYCRNWPLYPQKGAGWRQSKGVAALPAGDISIPQAGGETQGLFPHRAENRPHRGIFRRNRTLHSLRQKPGLPINRRPGFPTDRTPP